MKPVWKFKVTESAEKQLEAQLLSSEQFDEFWRTEEDFFAPILRRLSLSSLEQREKWAKESVRERALRVSKEVFNRCDGVVVHGPFKGMRLSQESWWSEYDLGSQCLGLYEHHVGERLVSLLGVRDVEPLNGRIEQQAVKAARQHLKLEPAVGRTFIDIGAADGYYAIGTLVGGLAERTICFESSAEGRQMIRRNWEKNGSPGELSIFGEATESSLLQVLDSLEEESKTNKRVTVLLVDIEGGEFALFSEAVVRRLAQTTVIIEIHNWVEDFMQRYSNLLRNFSRTHILSVIKPIKPNPYDFAELRDFTDDNRLLLSSKRRPNEMRFIQASPISASFGV